MKFRSILAISASLAAAANMASGAISIVAGSTAGPHLFMGNIGAGGSKWNTVPAGASANVYWDADKNGTFGETGKGENTGNAAGTLGFTTGAITGTTIFHFAVEGFANPGSNLGIDFDLHKTDASIQRLQVISGGATVNFADSNGDQWTADFVFNQGAYGDVVFNIGTGAGGIANDHQGVLTFTLIPEPSAVALFGLAGFGLILRRRR